MLAAARAQLENVDGPSTSPENTQPPRARDNSKKRVRKFSATDRAAHRIFEKSRRDAFRARLTELAEELPSLAGQPHHRLSKHAIVDESISRLMNLEATCIGALEDYRSLAKERDELLSEVNWWRNMAAVNQRCPVVSSAPPDGLVQVASDVASRSVSSGSKEDTRQTNIHESDSLEAEPDADSGEVETPALGFGNGELVGFDNPLIPWDPSIIGLPHDGDLAANSSEIIHARLVGGQSAWTLNDIGVSTGSPLLPKTLPLGADCGPEPGNIGPELVPINPNMDIPLPIEDYGVGGSQSVPNYRLYEAYVGDQNRRQPT